MDQFEWRTDEDEVGEALEQPAEPRLPPRRRRLLLLILVAALVLGVGGYRLYQTGKARVDEATSRVVSDVRASHELVRRAAMDADLELFTRFISSADPDWARAEEQLVAGERWLDRSTLDLTWQRSMSPTAAITLSADLTGAEVVSHEAYTFIRANGQQQTATLAQPHVYRLGPDRWLFAPPQATFWGQEAMINLPRIRLTYPARDEEVARRLAADLDALIERACNELQGLGCPLYYRMSVHFTRNPALLQTTQPGSLPLWTEEPLALPTPSLVGLPLSETAYHALYLGYARHVMAAAIAQLVDWRCCQQGLFYQALLEVQWHTLDLAPAPPDPPATAYRQMLQGQLDVGNAASLWAQVPVVGDSPALQAARAIVAFLRQRFPQQPVAAWQHALSRSERYPQWLATVTGEAAGPALAMGWYSYLYDRAGDEAPGSTPPRPDEDLLLLCDTETAGRRLMRFDSQTGSFSREIDGASLDTGTAQAILALAPPDGAYFASDGEDGALQIWRWQDGVQELLWDSGPAGDVQYHFEGASPGGHFIAVEVSDSQRSLPGYRVAEVATCLEGGCNWRQSVYKPAWSPDDRYVVNATPQGNMLYLAGTGRGAQSFWHMDMGGAPVWLDNDTFAYVKQRAGELNALVLTEVERRQVQTLVDVGDLHARLPPGTIVAPNIGLARHPLDGKVLFLALQTVRSERPTTTYVFLARRDTGQLFNLFSTTNADPRSLSIAPAGRWVALATQEGVLLYDLIMDRGGHVTEGRQEIGPLWSPDGNWLFTGGDGAYMLVAPGKTAHEIQAEGLSCASAIWLQSE